jgi:hypothetical protein
MRPPMRLLIVLALVAITGIGCGKEIGDACIVATDCDPSGVRMCDPPPGSKEGYCTIQGCDYNTCPEEATCVRFFTGEIENTTCVFETEGKETFDCSLDELCDLNDHCVPRASEVRYCMRKCDNNGDCRDGYECRTLELMMAHGGEPVLAPGVPVDNSAPKFCAAKPPS